MNYKIRYEQVMDEIKDTDKKLANLPDKVLFIRRDGKRGKWYSDDGEKKRYIPRKNKDYAEKLVMKKFYKRERKTHYPWVVGYKRPYFYLYHCNTVKHML